MEHASVWPNSPALELGGSAKRAGNVKSAVYPITLKVARLLARTATNFITLSVCDQFWRPFRSTAGSVVAVAFALTAELGRPAPGLRRDGTIIIPCATRAINRGTRATRVRFVARLTEQLLTGKWLNALFVRNLCTTFAIPRPI